MQHALRRLQLPGRASSLTQNTRSHTLSLACAPLLQGAIKKLTDELHEMEVRIGVVSHTLLQLSLKSRRQMHAQAAIMSDDEDL
jgi:hypothetical protein